MPAQITLSHYWEIRLAFLGNQSYWYPIHYWNFHHEIWWQYNRQRQRIKSLMPVRSLITVVDLILII